MISTKDEIMIALSGILDDVPVPPIPVFKPEDQKKDEEDEMATSQETEEIPWADPEEVVDIPLPIPIPDQPEDVPLASPEEVSQVAPDKQPEQISSWSEENMGTPAWVAEHYPYAYLFGHKPFLKFTGDPANDQVTRMLMEKIVTDNPEKYFEWGLRRKRGDLSKLGVNWEREAADSLTNKDPHAMLMYGIHSEDLKRDPFVLPTLWEKALDYELKRTSQSEGSYPFPGILFDRARELIRNIKKYHPGFYEKEVAFNPVAQRIMRGRRFPVDKQISSRDEPSVGSHEWYAKNYPKVYLRGQDKMGDYIRDEQDPEIAHALLDKIIQEDPLKYFEWNLRRVGDRGGRVNMLKGINDAAISLMDKDPYAALMLGRVHEHKETKHLRGELWDRLMALERKRNPEAKFDEIKRQMCHLVRDVYKEDRQLYDKKMKNTKYSVEDCGNEQIEMRRNLRRI